MSTISVITSAIATYLLARRSEYGLPAFVINDVILTILWTTVAIQGNINFLTILLTPAMLLVSDIYGTINWQKLKKSQIIMD